jgi:hypothetical protein
MEIGWKRERRNFEKSLVREENVTLSGCVIMFL